MRALLEGVTVEEMLVEWPNMLAAKMDEWQLDRAEMVELFGVTRDKWMAADLDGWLAPNRIYDGVAPAMAHAIAAADAEVFIVTTKQVRDPQRLVPVSHSRAICGRAVRGRVEGGGGCDVAQTGDRASVVTMPCAPLTCEGRPQAPKDPLVQYQ